MAGFFIFHRVPLVLPLCSHPRMNWVMIKNLRPRIKAKVIIGSDSLGNPLGSAYLHAYMTQSLGSHFH